MTKPTYADTCLERAEKATEGPWNLVRGKWVCCEIIPAGETSDSIAEYYLPKNGDFIAHARTDVPELARRLKLACDALRLTGVTLRRHGEYDEATLNCKIADELESGMPGEK